MSRFDSFTVIDLETTGLDPRNCEIIELGSARYEEGKLSEKFSQLVKPSASIPDEITRLTGIDDDMVKAAPSIESVFEDYQNRLESSTWVVGHNISFDLGFLRSHQDKKAAAKLAQRVLDTGVLARILFPRLPRYSLGTLIKYFNIDRVNAHRALDDCLATGQVYLKLISYLASLPVSSKESIGRILVGNQDIDIFSAALSPIEPVSSDKPIMAEYPTKKSVEAGESLEEYPENVIGISPPDSYDDYIEVDTAAVENHFLPGGILSNAISSFEYRPQQARMSIEIARAFNRSEFLLAEAPTGIGKSLAYLLPASWWTSLNRERLIISTQTKNLQSQLFYKDIPQIQKAVGFEFKAALLKGRGNYLCLLKYRELLAEAEVSYNKQDREALGSLILWAKHTRTGDISECHGFNPARNYYIWSRISCEGSFCLGQACQLANECFLLKIRRESQKAQVVVVNHYLTFADFASGGDLVRDAGHIIFDEAHNLEKVAASYLGYKLDKRSVDNLLADMYTSRPTQSGFLVGLRFSTSLHESNGKLEGAVNSVIDSVTSLNHSSGDFFAELSENLGARIGDSDAREIPYKSDANLCDLPSREELLIALKNLADRLDHLIGLVREADGLPKRRESIIRLEAFASDLRGFREMISNLLYAEDPDYVYWIEVPSSAKSSPRLLSAPLEVGKLLDREFYDHLKTAVFTSATMAVNRNFDFFIQRLGLDLRSGERTLSICLDSPFDIDSEVAVVTAGYLPSPKRPEFEQEAFQTLSEILASGAKKSMVLFTSHRSLKAAVEQLGHRLSSDGIDLFSQEGFYNAERILRRFKSSKKAVLFGTDTFWEGIDLPGALLELLILFKLPFTVPDRPWFKANLEKIEQSGQSPFSQLSLPDAVVKFRQGFGRLIRTAADRGCVVALDSRIEKSSFGSVFLKSVGGTKFKCRSPEEITSVIRKWLNPDS